MGEGDVKSEPLNTPEAKLFSLCTEMASLEQTLAVAATQYDLPDGTKRYIFLQKSFDKTDGNYTYFLTQRDWSENQAGESINHPKLQINFEISPDGVTKQVYDARQKSKGALSLADKEPVHGVMLDHVQNMLLRAEKAKLSSGTAQFQFVPEDGLPFLTKLLPKELAVARKNALI